MCAVNQDEFIGGTYDISYVKEAGVAVIERLRVLNMEAFVKIIGGYGCYHFLCHRLGVHSLILGGETAILRYCDYILVNYHSYLVDAALPGGLGHLLDIGYRHCVGEYGYAVSVKDCYPSFHKGQVTGS